MIEKHRVFIQCMYIETYCMCAKYAFKKPLYCTIYCNHNYNLDSIQEAILSSHYSFDVKPEILIWYFCYVRIRYFIREEKKTFSQENLFLFYILQK